MIIKLKSHKNLPETVVTLFTEFIAEWWYIIVFILFT